MFTPHRRSIIPTNNHRRRTLKRFVTYCLHKKNTSMKNPCRRTMLDDEPSLPTNHGRRRTFQRRIPGEQTTIGEDFLPRRIKSSSGLCIDEESLSVRQPIC
ncbi:hypothetical protein Hanom_Chr12g01118661 [Helianthus anomalus]